MNLDRTVARMIRRLMGIGALGAAVAGCGAVDDAGGSEADGASASTGTERDAILNGTAISEGNAANWGMVAVYHKYVTDPSTGATAWWPRPCSGTVVAVRGTSVYVSTARHCVTIENTINGALPGGSRPASSWIRVARGANPGPLVNGSPPTSIAASSVWGMTIGQTWSEANDGALIRVVTSGWGDLMTANKAVYMGEPSEMTGFELAAFGYGVSSNEPRCYNNPLAVTGIGKLRAADFIVGGGSRAGAFGSYYYINSNDLGQQVLCGDSGGPDLMFNFHGMPFIHLFGTHSAGEFVMTNTASGPWLSQMVGLILSPASDASLHLVRRADTVLTLTNNSSYTIFEYDPVTQQIYNRESSKVCLTWDISLNAFYLGACNGADPWQKWTVNGRGYIQRAGSSLCMRHMVNGWVEPRNCPSNGAAQSERARFTWLWRGKI
jgi:hypothetical protein